MILTVWHDDSQEWLPTHLNERKIMGLSECKICPDDRIGSKLIFDSGTYLYCAETNVQILSMIQEISNEIEKQKPITKSKSNNKDKIKTKK